MTAALVLHGELMLENLQKDEHMMEFLQYG